VLQILHVSDLHLFVPGALQKDLLLLKSQGGGFPLQQIAHLFTFSWGPAQDALPHAFRMVAGNVPATLILTGDIAALPYDHPQDIEQHYYRYVNCLLGALPPDSRSVVLLGNHDWPMKADTPFRNTSFDSQLRVLSGPRAVYRSVDGHIVIIFAIDTTRAILPATGALNALDPHTDTYLKEQFRRGRSGLLTTEDGALISGKTYRNSLKILLLHHYPLPATSYWGRLGWFEDRFLRLLDRAHLIDICKGEIDLFLFGHSHLPCIQVHRGHVMIDCGSTLATSTVASPPDAQFQKITVNDSGIIEVISYVFDGSRSDYIECDRSYFRRAASGLWGVI
jgi:hypothetical protein